MSVNYKYCFLFVLTKVLSYTTHLQAMFKKKRLQRPKNNRLRRIQMKNRKRRIPMNIRPVNNFLKRRKITNKIYFLPCSI